MADCLSSPHDQHRLQYDHKQDPDVSLLPLHVQSALDDRLRGHGQDRQELADV